MFAAASGQMARGPLHGPLVATILGVARAFLHPFWTMVQSDRTRGVPGGCYRGSPMRRRQARPLIPVRRRMARRGPLASGYGRLDDRDEAPADGVRLFRR